MYERLAYQSLMKALKTRRVVLLAGPRQSGKTTLVKKLFKEQESANFLTLDDLTLYKAAQVDPHGFIKSSKNILIIDEIQRVPQLLQAIKKQVDEDTRNGQFLITGSANIYEIPSVKESLAGRIQTIGLRTLTQIEINGSKPEFLYNAFQGIFISPKVSYDKDAILELCFKGGFPEILTLDNKDYSSWHQDYIKAVLERDLRDIANIQRHYIMHQLIKATAAWSGKFLDISSIGANLSINRHTLESYLNILETVYLIERMPAWTKTDYQRIARKPKLFMTDCGLVCSILNWKFDDIRLDSDRSGKIIETFVFNEISNLVRYFFEPCELTHYRDRENREIDFIVENSSNDILAIEVKAGSILGNEDFRSLKWFRDNIIQPQKKFVGIVFYTGDHVVAFGDRLWAVPISCLWQ